MKLALVTVGTRGDVQPYLAVALALVARGHEVWIATHDEHAPLVHAHGLEHRSIAGGMRELIGSELGRAWLTSAGSPRKYAKYAREIFGPLQRAWLEDADAAVEGADAVLYYAMAVHAVHAAERRGLPAVALAPWPLVPTRQCASVLAPWLEFLPGPLLRPANDLVLRLAMGGFNAEHLAHRSRVGLPRYREPDPIHFALARGVPTVHLFSEAVLPRPTDWDSQHEVAGFAFVPRSDYAAPTELEDFLDGGPAPTYIGFGSMTGQTPEELVALATGAARLAGVRAVVGSGWTGVAASTSSDVFVLDDIPHDWLFPRVSAVVHHGGIGTFAEGLRAGRPTVIAAFFADQPFWGRRNELLGTGPTTLQRSEVTSETLAAAIRHALADEGYRARAAGIAARLANEDGAGRAAELIERGVARSRDR